MTDCNRIKEIMVDYLSGELIESNGPESGPRFAAMEAHVGTCPRCREEYAVLKKIYGVTRDINDAADTSMESIDWEANAERIGRGVVFKRPAPTRTREFSFNPFHFNWSSAVPALAGVFLLGILLGYLLFYNPGQPGSSLPGAAAVQPETALSRLETTLAKRGMQDYFRQTQLLLTDLMRQCDDDGTASWSTGVNRREVRSLLNKNRYFNRELSNPQFLSTRRLLKQIEWLLYEMVTLDEGDEGDEGNEGGASCEQLRRIQEFIRKERLLLKLRLVGKDISYTEI